MKSNYKTLGNYIEKVEHRNINSNVTNLLGLSMTKEFRESTSNIIGTDLSVYKLVGKWNFACDFMSVIRVRKFPVVLQLGDKPTIVSPAYTVFKVKDSEILDPEYLMMWFRRPEFDRYAYFRCDGAVRGGFNWIELCESELPVPSIEVQREIVKEYHTIINRIKLNEQLIQKLEDTAATLYKQWFVDFEFPNENGKPYRSNKGEMVWCEELKQQIPIGWKHKTIGDICDIKGGKRLPKGQLLTDSHEGNPYIKVADMSETKYLILTKQIQYVDSITQKEISRYIVSTGDLIISIVGTIGMLNIIHESLNKANLTENCVKLTNQKNINSDYLYNYLISSDGKRILEERTVGGVQAKLPLYNIESIPIIYPLDNILLKFKNVLDNLNPILKIKTIEAVKLKDLRDLLFAKMSKQELLEIPQPA